MNELPDNSKTIIVDVGARYGIHPSFKSFEGDALHVLFEADEIEASRLRKKYLARSDVIIHSLGVTDIKCVKNLHIYEHRGFNSFLKPNLDSIWFGNIRESESAIVDTQEVLCESLDCIMDRMGLCADYIKINTEGTELDVLKGANKQLINAIGIKVETYFSDVFRGGCLFHDVSPFLKDYGFHLLNIDYCGQGSPIYPYVLSGKFGVLEKADTTWVRNWNYVVDTAIKNGEEILFKYASFCFINGAPDLALHTLTLYVDRVSKHINIRETKLGAYVDKLIQFHFNSILKHPLVPIDHVKKLYFKLTSHSLKLRNDFYESMEINPN